MTSHSADAPSLGLFSSFCVVMAGILAMVRRLWLGGKYGQGKLA